MRRRIVGADTRRNALDATDISEDFFTAVKESFNQQYQSFNLLVRFGNATLSKPVPAAQSNDTSAAGGKERSQCSFGKHCSTLQHISLHDNLL